MAKIFRHATAFIRGRNFLSDDPKEYLIHPIISIYAYVGIISSTQFPISLLCEILYILYHRAISNIPNNIIPALRACNNTRGILYSHIYIIYHFP